MIQRYMAAAAAGIPNMASRAPALKGQADAIQKLGDPVHAKSGGLGKGSTAGMVNNRAAMVEPAGTGYGKYHKKQTNKQVVMQMGSTPSPRSSMQSGSSLRDSRKYKRPALEMDKKLADLL
jgi:hypothetical protein